MDDDGYSGGNGYGGENTIKEERNMMRKTLIIARGTIQEYKPMGWLAKRRYSREVDRRLRYVCPPDMGWLALLETIFWLMLAGAAAACVIACPILFVRWWLCL